MFPSTQITTAFKWIKKRYCCKEQQPLGMKQSRKLHNCFYTQNGMWICSRRLYIVRQHLFTIAKIVSKKGTTIFPDFVSKILMHALHNVGMSYMWAGVSYTFINVFYQISNTFFFRPYIMLKHHDKPIKCSGWQTCVGIEWLMDYFHLYVIVFIWHCL